MAGGGGGLILAVLLGVLIYLICKRRKLKRQSVQSKVHANHTNHSIALITPTSSSVQLASRHIQEDDEDATPRGDMDVRRHVYFAYIGADGR